MNIDSNLKSKLHTLIQTSQNIQIWNGIENEWKDAEILLTNRLNEVQSSRVLHEPSILESENIYSSIDMEKFIRQREKPKTKIAWGRSLNGRDKKKEKSSLQNWIQSVEFKSLSLKICLWKTCSLSPTHSSSALTEV